MNNKEKMIIQSLKNLASDVEKPVFTEDEYALFRRCGMSEEEIKKMEHVEMMTQIIDVLPDKDADVQRLAMALGAISNEKDTSKNLANLKIIAEKDPKLLTQLFALTAIVENEAKE